MYANVPAQSAGPNAVAFVYLGGSGLQLGGENSIVRVDARTRIVPGFRCFGNAAAGTVAPASVGPYGSCAQTLAETMLEGGLPIAEVFYGARLRRKLQASIRSDFFSSAGYGLQA